MKLLAALAFSCFAITSAHSQISTNTLSPEEDNSNREVSVDGKLKAVIYGEDMRLSNPVSVTLSPGQHIVCIASTRKKNKVAEVIATEKKEELVRIESPKIPSILPRLTRIQKQIELTPEEKESIEIKIYDNGVVDGDSISLYRNDEPVLYNKRISEEPLTFHTSFGANEKNMLLKMQAQNLGTIAPNTALMVITTSKNRYTVNLSSDFTETATVEFLVKK